MEREGREQLQQQRGRAEQGMRRRVKVIVRVRVKG